MCLAVPGKVLSINDEDALRMGKVDFGGISKSVCLAHTPEAGIGDYVIVHVGFALQVIDEVEAQQIFEYLEQIDELGEARADSVADGSRGDFGVKDGSGDAS